MGERIVFTQQRITIQPVAWPEFLAAAQWTLIPVIYLNRDGAYHNRFGPQFNPIQWDASQQAAEFFRNSSVRHQNRNVVLVSYRENAWTTPTLLGAYVGRSFGGLAFELTQFSRCGVELSRPPGNPFAYHAHLDDLRVNTL